MATFSTLAKCFIATAVVGGGVTGAVLGATGARVNSVEQLVNPPVRRENQNNSYDSPSEQNSSLSVDLSDKEDNVLKEKEERVEQSSKREEDRSESVSPAQITQTSGESAPYSGSESTLLSKEPDLNPKSPEIEGPISGATQGEKSRDPELLKEKITLPNKDDLKSQPPKSPVKRPRGGKQTPKLHSAPTRRRERTPVKPKDVPSEPINVQIDYSKSNWFSIDLSGIEIFDANEWPYDECERDIKGEEVFFTCPWTEDKSKMIQLHLSISSDKELTGKKWKDVEELEFNATSNDFATLALTFSDGSATTLLLDRKVS